MRVLIVDDSLLSEFAIKKFLVTLGAEVVGMAKNGEAAKKLFNQFKPDLVTVDAVMPGMPGVELVKYINEQDKNNGHKTNIIMISSDPIPDQDRDDIHVDGYVHKPITLKKIREALRSLN